MPESNNRDERYVVAKTRKPGQTGTGAFQPDCSRIPDDGTCRPGPWSPLDHDWTPIHKAYNPGVTYREPVDPQR